MPCYNIAKIQGSLFDESFNPYEIERNNELKHLNERGE